MSVMALVVVYFAPRHHGNKKSADFRTGTWKHEERSLDVRSPMHLSKFTARVRFEEILMSDRR
jgi:hypothetical protein